ncbi:cytochrome P450 4d2-like [Culicoides brevitarsis]|uniref:cytochrome P450 4d2-like n=1 Tax=Culicoides brevitarsis TaxID=469753 RepID=UPI00307B1D65
MIISRDPKVTEAIVTNPKFEKSSSKIMLKPWIGDSLIISEGEKWFKMRKLCTPAFHFQILERFIPIYEEQTKVLIEILKKEMNTMNGVDIFPKLHLLTLDIIAETSMGAKVNAQLDSHHPFIKANERLIGMFDKRLFNGFLAVEWVFRMTSLYKIQEESIKFVNDFVDKVIQERHDKLLKDKSNLVETEESGTKKRPALLDILLQAKIDGNPLSNDDISAEVKTFMFAGHETTANSLSFTLYLLAKNPEVQDKVYHEIKTNIKSDHLTSRDLNSLSYLDNVCKESLRLFPPAFLIVKQSVEDLRVGDLLIPKNTSIATNIYSGHRMEKYFEDPEVFNPDRFDKEFSNEERNSYIFQPFSAGLRNCIGQRFAMLEMKTILVKLIAEFQCELVDENFEVDVIHMGILRPKNGVPLKFIERNS